ncbi:PD-(D/E)XK nuclease family protein [Streptosporangium saharense]|uniref:PD-(D/E)XK endonuclease-like domain-containing protein n=1 Tax=Streptosporangium saharense TaxID=1706840 RepID=A0A7W7VK84_9ACTN|nr:PD-(D/E)XK nuclease family protein [Streptosporangium saharense]MBB4913079.1 hypothetical protein [Streptosporangium saharense]
MKPFSGLIRVSMATLASGNYHCPASTAMKARLLEPVVPPPRKPDRLEDFALGPFMAALDQADFPFLEVRRGRPMHDGLRAWTEHALTMYRRAFPAGAESGLEPVYAPWTRTVELRDPDHRSARRYEITAWGRRLASPDNRIRELRLPVYRISRLKNSAERSVAALVAATGSPGPLPEHVRVLQFGLLDGQVEPLFSGSPQDAQMLFDEHGRSGLEKAVDNNDYRPGSACVTCKYTAACPALPRAPGLLGITDRTQPRRTWSPSNGRAYRACPARDHLRRLNLPKDHRIDHSASADRGRAIHHFLADRHRVPAAPSCDPAVPEQWNAVDFVLPENERLLGARLLRQHAAVCPLLHARTGSAKVEPTLTFHDENADVFVITTPDLLYLDGDSWVWREVKTRSRDCRRTVDLLEDNPQLSLAILLLARGELGGSRTRSRVELEILHPDGVDLEILDPFTMSVQVTARQVLEDHLREWHADRDYAPRPGIECGRCEVARWCSAASTSGAET